MRTHSDRFAGLPTPDAAAADELDRIMFSVDYPFAPNRLATDWLARAPLCAANQAKLAGGNVKRLQM